MTVPKTPTGGELTAAAAWSERVRRVGGFIQLAFATFWLVRGCLSIGRGPVPALIGGIVVIVVVVLVYAIRVTSGTGQRPTGPDAKRIERSVNGATVIELVASFALPVIVSLAGHGDWILPSIAITIGPFILVATMSGTALAATTGLAAGVLMLGTATAGFQDLSHLRPSGRRRAVDAGDDHGSGDTQTGAGPLHGGHTVPVG